MHTLLLPLAMGLLCDSHCVRAVEINGKWRSIAEAADNVEKIQEGGPLRTYLRELQCLQGCQKLSINFYVKLNGECREFSTLGEKRPSDGSYTTDYSGQNNFKIHDQEDGAIVFASTNVDENGRRTRLLLLAARNNSLTPAQEGRFNQLAEENGIPQENIEKLADSDTCPD